MSLRKCCPTCVELPGIMSTARPKWVAVLQTEATVMAIEQGSITQRLRFGPLSSSTELEWLCWLAYIRSSACCRQQGSNERRQEEACTEPQSRDWRGRGLRVTGSQDGAAAASGASSGSAPGSASSAACCDFLERAPSCAATSQRICRRCAERPWSLLPRCPVLHCIFWKSLMLCDVQ